MSQYNDTQTVQGREPTQFKILEKDVVDEIIFRTRNSRNRLLLELMARGCMSVGEVLKVILKRYTGLTTSMDNSDNNILELGSSYGYTTLNSEEPPK
jgi:hypothetical protein